MDRRQIEEIVNIYLRDLGKKIKVEKAILFGSAVSGFLDKDGDIDLLILSGEFGQMEAGERFDILYLARTDPLTQSAAMDIFGLTPREFQEASDVSLVGEIKEKGKEIFLKV
ncbi:MAG: polymerase beta domain protein region protein [Candidatus Gottesmanbacteria bacterium GW2011_GWC2_39_8]|uniref:Polymerase beta domain protein region protein n=1 Tax=Candidatus Gottesmanbacteria bacterium GW2011_GWC2_39_8 TaxID=1618450 RepID=A0A0G0S501_9BACT|nr:MAG: polymerase beta domain protein region protein [Candidatus Gottesmanbacteria bacterium GW2011_GWC2_39_8]